MTPPTPLPPTRRSTGLRAFTLVELPVVRRRERAAFTLVELLVVLGIIILVVSLLLPSIVKARRQAALTHCLAQVRELGQAVITFVDSHDGAFPQLSDVLGGGSGVTGGGGTGLIAPRNDFTPAPGGGERARKGDMPGEVYPNIAAALLRYVGSDGKIWKCPDQPVKRPGEPGKPSAFIFHTTLPPGYDPLKQGPFSLPLALPGSNSSDDTSQFQPGYWYAGPVGGAGGRPRDGAGGGWGPLMPLPAAKEPLYWGGSAEKPPVARIVLFTDRSTLYHSRTDRPPHTAPPGSATWRANFGYLDGHAETKNFRSQSEYRALFDPGGRPPHPFPEE